MTTAKTTRPAPTPESLDRDRRGQRRAIEALRSLLERPDGTPDEPRERPPFECLSWGRGLWPENSSGTDTEPE